MPTYTPVGSNAYNAAAAAYANAPKPNQKFTPTYTPVGSNAYNAAAAAYANAPKPVLGSTSNTTGSSSTTTQATTQAAPVSSGGGGGVNAASIYNEWQSQIKQAAEDAYNRGKAALQDAYNSKIKSLLNNYNSATEQLGNSYNTAKSGIEADAAKSLREAYINNMLNKRDLNQLLSAQGLSGGASETTLAKLLNTYGNNRNNINTATNRNLTELETSHNANLAEALQNYNDALANAQDIRMQYLMQLEQNRANSIANATPSLSTLAALFG